MGGGPFSPRGAGRVGPGLHAEEGKEITPLRQSEAGRAHCREDIARCDERPDVRQGRGVIPLTTDEGVLKEAQQQVRERPLQLAVEVYCRRGAAPLRPHRPNLVAGQRVRDAIAHPSISSPSLRMASAIS